MVTGQKSDALNDVMKGCMAQKGYVIVSKDQAPAMATQFRNNARKNSWLLNRKIIRCGLRSAFFMKNGKWQVFIRPFGIAGDSDFLCQNSEIALQGTTENALQIHQVQTVTYVFSSDNGKNGSGRGT